ncbi:replicative DNA helicase [Alicyclobacillus cycloheptanicus]|uniref:Replicative DNA helicase n=1 Tax=Alicyclobacillus cycloheptanicus TaxID=1457 RepID=A0ABT9XKU6_9BACL|nr:replicative DNA helicase [Alicyclobacillus cycloheptanicus]MDQ0190928.1 replicative DNA helicase [Alicyclobacillus cycloheptanicus]WDM02378.1 replicative DNA helicase [Alicyclobacillus cycloheptanicus]
MESLAFERERTGAQDDPVLRLPPQHIEAEQAVLGAMLISSDAAAEAAEALEPEDFYRTNHQLIFTAMRNLYEQGQPVDVVTTTSALQTMDGALDRVGGVEYVATLAASIPTAQHIDQYIEIVREKALLRRIIQTATAIATEGYSGERSGADVLADAERRILELSAHRKVRDFTHIADVLETTFERIEQLFENAGRLTGVATGYTDLDRMTSGFQKSDLIIVAARPSVGKTAFALNIAQNVAIREGQTVAIFSLEMSKDQLVQRMLCAEAYIDGHKLRTGALETEDWPRLSMGVSTLGNAPIYIDDTPGITVPEMRSKLRRLKSHAGLGLVVIDYLQLIQGRRGSGENRQQEISEISRMLKQLARELEVPVISLAQLSRSVEQRQDKRPMLSDIRESGSIEQDADIVAFLYRDDYYNPETEKKNVVEIHIGKQRNGPTGTVELVFLKNYNKFVNLDKNHSAS